MSGKGPKLSMIADNPWCDEDGVNPDALRERLELALKEGDHIMVFYTVTNSADVHEHAMMRLRRRRSTSFFEFVMLVQRQVNRWLERDDGE